MQNHGKALGHAMLLTSSSDTSGPVTAVDPCVVCTEARRRVLLQLQKKASVAFLERWAEGQQHFETSQTASPFDL